MDLKSNLTQDFVNENNQTSTSNNIDTSDSVPESNPQSSGDSFS